MSRAAGELGGVRASPNIWAHPEIYEWENLAFDRHRRIEETIGALRPYAEAHLLDIGCGTGFHLPHFAERGARVVGVEPHPPLARLARARLARTHHPATPPASLAPDPPNPGGRSPDAPDAPDADGGSLSCAGRCGGRSPDDAATPDPGTTDADGPGAGSPSATPRPEHSHRPTVVVAAAQALPLADASVDIVHARWAYFFGPGCEPGLREIARVARPGAVAVIVDNDATTSTFGAWFARFHPAYDPVAVERFWRRAGFSRIPLTLAWECRSEAEFAQVVGIEFAPDAAAAILAEHPGPSVDYAVNLWWRRF